MVAWITTTTTRPQSAFYSNFINNDPSILKNGAIHNSTGQVAGNNYSTILLVTTATTNNNNHDHGGSGTTGASTRGEWAPFNNTCVSYVSFTYDVVLLIVCVLFLVIGLVYSFFGYRLYKIVLFLTGFVFGSVLIFLLCEKEQLLSTPGNVGVALGTGVLVGLITALVQYVGLFMTGFLTGLLWGLLAMVTWTSFSPPVSYWAPFMLLFTVGILFALLTLKFQRIMIVMATSFLGGALLAVSLDYFIEQFALIFKIWSVLNLKPIEWHKFCWFAWAVMLIWPIIFVLGILVQFKLTGVGFTHKTGWPHHFRTRRRNHSREDSRRHRSDAEICCRITQESNHRGSVSVTHVPHHYHHNHHTSSSTSSSHANRTIKEKSPPEPRSFRHLYQARRKHGDVICQSYVESLQKLAQQQLSARRATTGGTTISDRTQLTVISNGSNRSNSNSGSV